MLPTVVLMRLSSCVWSEGCSGRDAPPSAAAPPPSDPSRSFGHRQAGPLLPSAASAPPASRQHALHPLTRRPTHMTGRGAPDHIGACLLVAGVQQCGGWSM
jgi:hypothetical protein